LKNEPYETEDFILLENSPNIKIVKSEEIFDATLLSGSSREPYNNWLEALNGVEKMYLIDKIFKKLEEILNKPSGGDFPVVYEYQGKYYIGNDGKHRLTVCKYLKKSLKVNLTKYIDI
jgi:hypothetical protein